MLLALGIVLALLAGPQVPFLGNVAGNIVGAWSATSARTASSA